MRGSAHHPLPTTAIISYEKLDSIFLGSSSSGRAIFLQEKPAKFEELRFKKLSRELDNFIKNAQKFTRVVDPFSFPKILAKFLRPT